jgi:hypothetical protein
MAGPSTRNNVNAANRPRRQANLVGQGRLAGPAHSLSPFLSQSQNLSPTYRPPPSYTAFWDALLASTVYSSIRTQSMASLPMNTLATEFIALLGDAKAGRPNEAAIQASLSAVFATGTFTEADAAEFTAALAVGLLDDIYTLT